jgi:hypothetical protein
MEWHTFWQLDYPPFDGTKILVKSKYPDTEQVVSWSKYYKEFMTDTGDKYNYTITHWAHLPKPTTNQGSKYVRIL